MDIEVTAEPEQMPAPAEVQALLASAAAALGPGESASLAAASARLYSWARAMPGAATASAHAADRLVGFGYGYSWQWATMTDPWSLRLADQLGGVAADLDGSFAVVLLVVAPNARRGGLGSRLLTALADQADEPATWLHAPADSPLNALCRAMGWQPLPSHADAAGAEVLVQRC